MAEPLSFDDLIPTAGRGEGRSPYGGAISSIESGGRYDLLGPVTRRGDRAYGKYQVMGENVGPWTTEVFGKAMTPEQFLRNPEAQEAVFTKKFDDYAKKYGPEGASRAWFAGEGGMNDMGRRDQLGTSVGEYSRRFQQAMPQDQGAPGGDAMAFAPPQGIADLTPEDIDNPNNSYNRELAAAPRRPAQQPVRVRTPDEARRLPRGTPIILPDGSVGRVP